MVESVKCVSTLLLVTHVKVYDDKMLHQPTPDVQLKQRAASRDGAGVCGRQVVIQSSLQRYS